VLLHLVSAGTTPAVARLWVRPSIKKSIFGTLLFLLKWSVSSIEAETLLHLHQPVFQRLHLPADPILLLVLPLACIGERYVLPERPKLSHPWPISLSSLRLATTDSGNEKQQRQASGSTLP